MIQKHKVLTQEDNSISHIYTRRTTIQEAHPIIRERKIPVNTTEQTWIFGVEEKARVSRTIPKLVNTLVNILKWLNYLGSVKIDGNRLSSRQNDGQNFKIKGIGL
jgi:hypothetical protein